MENGLDSEIVFRDEQPEREESAPPMKLTDCLREVQLHVLRDRSRRDD